MQMYEEDQEEKISSNHSKLKEKQKTIPSLAHFIHFESHE